MSQRPERRWRQWGLNLAYMIVGTVVGGVLAATWFAVLSARFEKSVGDLRTEVIRLNKELSDLKEDLASRRGKFIPLVSQAGRKGRF